MVKFMHLRPPDGKKHSNGRIYPCSNGGMTVAYTEDQGVIHFAVAFCSEKDNFNYKIGRMKAAGRLDSDKWRYSIHNYTVGTVPQYILMELLTKGLWCGSVWFRAGKPPREVR